MSRALSGSLAFEHLAPVAEIAFADVVDLHRVFVVVSDTSVFRAAMGDATGGGAGEPPWSTALARDLAVLFDEHDVEDGRAHVAERVLHRVLREQAGAAEWCSRAVLRPETRWRASLLRILGRQDIALVLPWGYDLAALALMDSDIEVRDAAVRALEHWGGEKAIELLGRHVDAAPWLTRYAQRVAAELSED
jgi:hypothetical protein